MKRIILLAALVVTSGFINPSIDAANKTDFSDLEGRYKGVGTFRFYDSEGAEDINASGGVNFTVNVPRSAKSAEIIVNGSVIANNAATPIFSQIKFSGRRSFHINQFLFSISDAGEARGTFKALRNKTTFSALLQEGADTASLSGNVSVSRSGKLKLVYFLTLNTTGERYQFNFEARRSGR